MQYTAKPGDSPARIARTYGVSMDALLRANPRKPTTWVAGQLTWTSLLPSEEIIVPVGGMVGSPTSDVVDLLVAGGGPCLQANAGYVCQIQSILGLTVDGKWGNNTASAVRALAPNAPGPCSPSPSWWVRGVSACPSGGGAAPSPSPTPSAGSKLDTAANAAVAALLGDSNYCVSVKRVGSSVNTAIHNFKAAWNSANPSSPVPIGTGNYEPSVQLALASALGTSPSNVPPGCGAAAVAPAPAPAPQPANVTIAPAPSSYVDPCNPANVAATCAAQRSLGVSPDGKWGTDSATAARRMDPNAPGPCSPRPTWWAPKGVSNCPGAAAPAITKPQPIVTPTAVPAAVQALTSIDPCSQSNVAIVGAAQLALGVSPDGKYGTDTAAAAQRILPTAPAGCSPRPAWWAAKGQTNYIPKGGCPPGSQLNPATGNCEAFGAPPPPPGKTCPTGTTFNPSTGNCDSTGGQPIVVTPVVDDKKKLSTGAIVAGAVGAAALVGLIAVAVSGKKTGHRGSRGPRGHGAHRKSSHRKKR